MTLSNVNPSVQGVSLKVMADQQPAPTRQLSNRVELIGAPVSPSDTELTAFISTLSEIVRRLATESFEE